MNHTDQFAGMSREQIEQEIRSSMQGWSDSAVGELVEITLQLTQKEEQ